MLSSLKACSQKGIAERFDATAGGSTSLMPFGGKYQLTPIPAMCSRIPTLTGNTTAGTIFAHGFDPYLAEISPFHGAVFASIDAVTKYVAMGGDYKKAWFTLQEYFEKLGTNPEKWGKPFAALLGAYHVQKGLGIAAIGGKDSMSGTYNEIDVPPTLVAFCVGVVDTEKVVSNEYKKAGSKVVLLKTKITEDFMPDLEDLKENYNIIHKAIGEGKILSCASIRGNGIAHEVFKSAIGNKLGFKFESEASIFSPMFGSFIIELAEGHTSLENKTEVLGETTANAKIELSGGEILDLDELIHVWEKPLENVFPTRVRPRVFIPGFKNESVQKIVSDKTCNIVAKNKFAAPRIFIPVLPGTNSEYEIVKAFEEAGAIAKVGIFKNLESHNIQESIFAYEKEISEAQIIAIPGGASGGDEPDGAGKFIATVFRNAKIKEAVHKHLQEQDGLILGIGNGFQALVKLGLLPNGEILDVDQVKATLALNEIGRHQSKMVKTKITSKLSPWFSKVNLGDEFIAPASYAEGRFVASDEIIAELIANGQIATQYVDLIGNPTNDIRYNPGGAMRAIEGITSEDGRILGRMVHPERVHKGNVINVLGNLDTKLFEAGVEYFK